jgi:hypothetical protein
MVDNGKFQIQTGMHLSVSFRHGVLTRATLRACVIAVLVSGCAFSASAQSIGASDSTVNAIRKIYEKGSYLSAEVEARRCLEQQSLADSIRIPAEQYLAFALVAQGKTKPALRHFIAILEIDSTFELDPIYTSPKILAAFNEAKQMKHAERRSDPSRTAEVTRTSGPGVSWRSLVFPGWEQVHQDRDTKGFALMGAGAITAGLSVVFEIERASARSEYLAASTPAQAVDRYDRYNRAQKLETYSIIAFAAVYLFSEIDAFVNLPHSDAVTLQPDAAGLRLAIRF